MSRLGVIVRLLMLAACLVPFTSTRQAATAFALASEGSPATPEEREDDIEREEEDGEKVRLSRPQTGRVTPPPPPHVLTLPPLPAPAFAPKPLFAVPAPLDPFHNGLGAPYLC